MNKITFSRQEMLDILWSDHDDVEIVRDIIIGHSRWSVIHELVFKFNDKYYRTTYNVGATEYQSEPPWGGLNAVECTEVRPVEKLVIEYEEVE